MTTFLLRQKYYARALLKPRPKAGENSGFDKAPDLLNSFDPAALMGLFDGRQDTPSGGG